MKSFKQYIKENKGFGAGLVDGWYVVKPSIKKAMDVLKNDELKMLSGPIQNEVGTDPSRLKKPVGDAFLDITLGLNDSWVWLTKEQAIKVLNGAKSGKRIESDKVGTTLNPQRDIKLALKQIVKIGKKKFNLVKHFKKPKGIHPIDFMRKQKDIIIQTIKDANSQDIKSVDTKRGIGTFLHVNRKKLPIGKIFTNAFDRSSMTAGMFMQDAMQIEYVEDIMDDERPGSSPKREGSTFMFSSTEDALIWQNQFGKSNKGNIYEVEPAGEFHKGDMRIIETMDAEIGEFRGDVEFFDDEEKEQERLDADLRKLAKTYWASKPLSNAFSHKIKKPIWEYVVPKGIKILRKLK